MQGRDPRGQPPVRRVARRRRGARRRVRDPGRGAAGADRAGVSTYYDLEQFLRPQGVVGPAVAALVPPLLASMTGAVDEVQDATAAGDLDRVTRAAHRCRNDAMVLGAHQLLRALP